MKEKKSENFEFDEIKSSLHVQTLNQLRLNHGQGNNKRSEFYEFVKLKLKM